MSADIDPSTLTKEEAIELLNKAAAGQNKIVMNPALYKRLVELGVPFEETEGETLEEFFERAKKHAMALIGDLPPLPEWLDYQFRRPYLEARMNLLIGQHGASITLSAILLESFLKWSAYCVEVETSQNVPAERWQELEKSQFGDAIGYAKRWGLVDKALSKQLDEFRDKIRNVQAHSMLAKAVAQMDFHKAAVVDVGSKTHQSDQVVSALENPTISALAKEKLDEERAVDVFTFMHDCMEHLFVKGQEILATKSEAKHIRPKEDV